MAEFQSHHQEKQRNTYTSLIIYMIYVLHLKQLSISFNHTKTKKLNPDS